MIKKAKKLWSKKLKATFISVALCVVLAVSGAAAAIGISVNNNKNLGGTLADGTANQEDLITSTPLELDSTIPAALTPAQTFTLTGSDDNMAAIWKQAIDASSATKVVKVVLGRDWIARDDDYDDTTEYATERHILNNVTYFGKNDISETGIPYIDGLGQMTYESMYGNLNLSGPGTPHKAYFFTALFAYRSIKKLYSI